MIEVTRELVDRARERAEELFPDDPAAVEYCMSDWSEGAEHWEWLIGAVEDDIREWVEDGRRNG